MKDITMNNEVEKIVQDALRRAGVAPDKRQAIKSLDASVSASRDDARPRTSAIHGTFEKYLPDFGGRERRRVLDALVAGGHAVDDVGDEISASAGHRDENAPLKVEAVRTLARFGVNVSAGRVSVHELDRVFAERGTSLSDRFRLKALAARAGVLLD
jgi:hypothetical protein